MAVRHDLRRGVDPAFLQQGQDRLRRLVVTPVEKFRPLDPHRSRYASASRAAGRAVTPGVLIGIPHVEQREVTPAQAPRDLVTADHEIGALAHVKGDGPFVSGGLRVHLAPGGTPGGEPAVQYPDFAMAEKLEEPRIPRRAHARIFL